MKGVMATLNVKDDAGPIFHKAGPVPLTLFQPVDELQWMQDEGIIYPVDLSEWVTPLVCVPKPNVQVHLCGDYKITVHTVLHMDQHSFPWLWRCWPRLHLGRNFPKLNSKVCTRSSCLMTSPRIMLWSTYRQVCSSTCPSFGTSSCTVIWWIHQPGIANFGWCFCDPGWCHRHRQEWWWALGKSGKASPMVHKVRSETKSRQVCLLVEYSCVLCLPCIRGWYPTHRWLCSCPINGTELRLWLALLNFFARYLPNISSVLHPLHKLLGNNKK